jgi:hypothetical protein
MSEERCCERVRELETQRALLRCALRSCDQMAQDGEAVSDPNNRQYFMAIRRIVKRELAEE